MLKTPKKVHCKNCHSCDNPCGALISVSSRELRLVLKQHEQSLSDTLKTIQSEDKKNKNHKKELKCSYLSGQIAAIKAILDSAKDNM
jgi:high-affinity Fe2+/Pb2+ permease